ncbi:MAG: SPOR domain-containing protein [Candidatus Omnitrophica bacterium]|nr:SPOR domain-containing protein [Candidatus Omnitrophota bacterium]
MTFTRGFLILAMTAVLFPAAAMAVEDLTSIRTAFLQGQYEEVVAQSRELLVRGNSDRHAESSRQEELLYLQGTAALKLRDTELAQTSLRRLLSDYPNSRWAAQASAALKGISRAAEENYFSVQLGAFETRANADRLKVELERRGYPAEVTDAVMDGRTLYRVRVGRFSSRVEAQAQVQRLRVDGFPGEVVP